MLLVLCTHEDYTLRTRNSRHTHRFISTRCRSMCSLDEIPLKVALDCVEISLSEKDPVGDPEMKVPDCTQILHDTKYSFTLEKRIMAACEELQRKNRKAKKLPQSVCPTCPPYWLMFSSPQQSRVGRSGSRESWELGPRPRSSSLNAADSNRLRPLRVAQFLISTSDFEGGYSEDDEGSSTEEDASRSKKRPQSSGPQSKVHIQRVSTPQVTRPGGSSTRPSSASALKETRKPLPQTPEGIPHTSRAPRRKPAAMRTSGRRSSHTQLQQRPSSAGPLPSTRQQKPTSHGVRPRTSAGLQDASADLLCALSEEERDLLEAVTKHGYTLHTAIMALQRTGPKSPDQILSYLTSCDRLCRLGYEKTQVEEALEMFPNCESKAAEFLFLLAQFCEMGFQQSTIKEVLLVHENHKERALEELMTRSG